MVLGTRIDNCRYPAFGVNGGLNGAGGQVIINPDTNSPKKLKPLGDGNVLKCGDLIRIITPGGGGWGSPYDRCPSDVLNDVMDGKVSKESALKDYGVVLQKSEREINESETLKVRESASRSQKMFHRKHFYDASEDRVEHFKR